MNKALIFIALKIVEISGASGFLYLCYLLGRYINPDYHWAMQIMGGFVIGVGGPLVAFYAVAVIGVGVWELIKKNIEWANKIAGGRDE